MIHKGRKEGIFFKEISVRVIKELHPVISPKEKRRKVTTIDIFCSKDRSR
jgi:hypothetical protein